MIEVMEADFMSPVLTARATMRTIDFQDVRQRRLVELILKNANTLLGALDGVNDFDDSRLIEKALMIVEKMALKQKEVTLEIALDEMEAVQDRINHATER